MSPMEPTARPLERVPPHLRAVLDYEEVIRMRQLENRIHVGGPSREVDNDDGLGARRDRPADRIGCHALAVAFHVREHGFCTSHDATTC